MDHHAEPITAFWYRERGARILGFTRPNHTLLKQLIHNLFENL